MTSKIVVNNIEADSGINTVTFNSNISGNLIGNVTGNVTGNVNSTGVTTVTSLRIGTGTSISSPATNVLTLGTNNVESVRIDSSGNLGIGTNNPTKALHISQNSDVAIRMHSGNSNTNARSWEIVVGGNASNNAEMVFRTRNDAGTGGSEAARFTASGNLAFPSGQGIDFSATANSSGTMNSELLSDYETGTWTPIAGSNAGSITSYLSGGNYTKIGDTVRVNGYINITNQGTASGNYLQAAGLPFTSSGGIIHIGVCREQSVNGYLITAQVSDNITTAFFSRWDNSGVIINGNFHFTIVYKTSS